MAGKSNSAGTKGPSQRQLRVGESVRHALTSVLQRGDLRDPVLEGAIVSVGEVRMSPDLKIATAYVTALGHPDLGLVIKALNTQARAIRGLVSPQLKQMKYMPEFRFREDTSFTEFEKIDRLLRSEAVRRDVEKPDDEH